VGVALLLALTVVAVGALTVATGDAVERGAAAADAGRVADDVAELADVTGGSGTVRLRFADGRLRTVDREVRVLDRGGVVRTVDVGGLVYERGRHRVAFVAGAVVRGRGDRAWVHTGPRLRASGGTLLVSVVALGADAGRGVVAGGGTGGAALRTAPTHGRTDLPADARRVAVETETPAAWERALSAAGARAVERRDLDGDGVASVVGTFPPGERAYLAVHDLRAEVVAGG
jgi:hypothetical protein